MKNLIKIKTIVLCFALSINSISAQTTKVYPDPDAVKSVYSYNEGSNEADELQSAELTSEERRAGFASSEYFYYSPGEKSPVRIKKQPKTNFIVKLQGKNSDPNTYFKLYKMQINTRKKRRELIVSTEGVGGQNVKFEPVYYTQKKVREIDEHTIIRLLTIDNLEPGEYVWCNGGAVGSGDAFFFGID